MNDWRQDDDFEAYLKKRLRTGRGLAPFEPLEPPEEVDRLIIGKARRAIERPTHVSHFRAPQWSLSLGLAATILISLSVLLDLGMRGAMQKDAVRGRAAPGSEAAVVVAEPAPINTTPWAPLPRAATSDQDDERSRTGRDLAERRARRTIGKTGAPEIETVTIIAQRVAMETSLPRHYRN